MATATRLASVLCCAASVAFAQKPLIYDVRDLLADRDGRWPAQMQDWGTRVNALTELADAALRRKSKDWSVTSEGEQYLLVSAGPDEQREFRDTLMQLRRGMVRALELQISLIRMPAAIATANALEDGKSKDVTPDQVALILRQVQEAHGTLANLPEIHTQTLHAFEKPVPAGSPPAKGELAESRFVVRGQMLPLDDVGAVHLDLCELKPEKGAAKDAPLWSCVAAMEVGKGVLLTRIQGDLATLMWVRTTTPAEESKPGSADPTGGQGGKK